MRFWVQRKDEEGERQRKKVDSGGRKGRRKWQQGNVAWQAMSNDSGVRVRIGHGWRVSLRVSSSQSVSTDVHIIKWFLEERNEKWKKKRKEEIGKWSKILKMRKRKEKEHRYWTNKTSTWKNGLMVSWYLSLIQRERNINLKKKNGAAISSRDAFSKIRRQNSLIMSLLCLREDVYKIIFVYLFLCAPVSLEV